MTVIFLTALVTLVIALYLQARTDARRIRRLRSHCDDAGSRSLILMSNRQGTGGLQR